MSSSIREALKGHKNNISCWKYLPYSCDDLKIYLESLFEPWMTWDNYGYYQHDKWDDNDLTTWKWNIDHIIPQSDLPYLTMEDDNFNKCWEFKNLRPYNAKQNVLYGIGRKRHLC